MIDTLRRFDTPFSHWVSERFIDPAAVREINATWPAEEDADWYIERAGYAKKSALMFPRRLHAPAQALAQSLYSADACEALSDLVGFELLPDPWMLDGPPTPRLGGGLHEIGQGGMLKIHVDFDIHPSGLERAANLLIYLNEGWQDEWGGALELHGASVKKIFPRAGTAVFFATNAETWHGHPYPLECPPDRSRRSLALYYYRAPTNDARRQTTVYRK